MIHLYLAKSGDVNKSFVEIVKRRKGNGVAVLMAKPYGVVAPAMKKAKVNPDRLIFINAIGKEEAKNVIPASIDNLTALSITISETLNALPGNNKFIVFDSISPLLLYNEAKTVSRFFMFIINQFRQWDVDAYFIATEEGIDPSVIALLKQNCDEVIGGKVEVAAV